MQALAIIPARYASTRFPGKPLVNRTGKTLIQHVVEQTQEAACLSRVVVATDDKRIEDAVKAFGGEVVMTRGDHPNGTSRLAEAAEQLGLMRKGDEETIVVNVQGDEPEIDPAVIDAVVQELAGRPDCVMSTVASPFSEDEDVANPNIVKVVLNQQGSAMYFSRSLIPHARTAGKVSPLKHVGLYAYRPSFLRKYVGLSSTPLEQAESLEQLRVLEHGFNIAVAIHHVHHHGIDTPEQYEIFVRRYTR